MSIFFIGSKNAEMINNLTVDIVDNSFGKDCIILSEKAFNDLKPQKVKIMRIYTKMRKSKISITK